MRIRYGPCECDLRYAICEYAVGRANAICEYAIGRANAICEYATGRANAVCNTRIGYARYANTLWAARIRYAIRKQATRYEQLRSSFLGHHTIPMPFTSARDYHGGVTGCNTVPSSY